jgi:hypothetical protein
MLEQYADFLEPYCAGKWHTWVRFGRWAAILDCPLPGAAGAAAEAAAAAAAGAEPTPSGGQGAAAPAPLGPSFWRTCVATALYAKGVASAAQGDVAAAAAFQTQFVAAKAAVREQQQQQQQRARKGVSEVKEGSASKREREKERKGARNEARNKARPKAIYFLFYKNTQRTQTQKREGPSTQRGRLHAACRQPRSLPLQVGPDRRVHNVTSLESLAVAEQVWFGVGVGGELLRGFASSSYSPSPPSQTNQHAPRGYFLAR